MPAMPYGWQTKPRSEAGSMDAKQTEGVDITAIAGYRKDPIDRSDCRQNATPSGASAPPPSEREIVRVGAYRKVTASNLTLFLT